MTHLITLLTDFGTSDSYVAEVKAVLLSRALGAALVDVTHQIPPGDVRSAQYVLARVWHRFPEGTVHLVVVDPGVGTSRRALAAGAAGREVGVLRGTFGDVGGGRLVAFGGGEGGVEMAVGDGSAARLLGVGVGAEVRA